MITVQYKEGNEWKTDDNTFATLDIAKAHTVKEGYAQYKVWNDTTLLAHLFNQVVAKPRPKKTKLEEPTPVVEHVDVELDTPEEE
jgi:hypothetical protein